MEGLPEGTFPVMEETVLRTLPCADGFVLLAGEGSWVCLDINVVLVVGYSTGK